ncbi:MULTISPECIES: GNAT family N-acetyltransferase [Neisseria]|uniref:N-acetyltransferase domain-containing protein n=1 Tax=Neisseria musculi TaxID=1815583 RepID=A0A7H1MA89_9NEIS|nr:MULTISPECIES: GNAT family N-acetyltransferase [Neisseria]MBF0803933.1 GNAT family N-acetyltransferase [Neisseria sp. 19428wB4_WF04]QNT58554.1 acetyltransferase family protein [Neisseria musculi]TFU43360.1 GNAT family N-acetyltransferase [Neisseria sp. WF04]
MLICNPYEIVIHGTTGNGKVFRPSDWAERLCGILSSFDKGHRLSYHEWVRPILVDKIRCVAVDKKLEEINPPMFRFLMDFAADNDLRVMDCKALIDERAKEDVGAGQERVSLSQAIQEKQAVEQQAATVGASLAAESVLREISAEDTAVAFAALSILRSGITDVTRFVEQVNKRQRPQGYRLFGIFEEGKANAVAVCGFREKIDFASGRHLHIDDIVTIPHGRSKGYAARLLAEVRRIAEEGGIGKIRVSSDVGSERTSAHRLYFENGFEIDAFHFSCKING